MAKQIKQTLNIIFISCVFFSLMGCLSSPKTKGGRSFFDVWGKIIKGENEIDQDERQVSFRKNRRTHQIIYDLSDREYNIKILGSTNSPPGLLSFKEIGSQTGFAVASADVNGDKIDDLIVGAPNAEGPLKRPYRSGWVYIFFGSRQNPNTVLSANNADVSLFGGKSNTGILLGSSLATADINGDGIQDIIIGAPKGNGPRNKRFNTGIIFVVFGKKSLSGIKDLSKEADITIYGSEQEDLCGYALASGDINGDGLADILIGAPAGDGYKNRYKGSGETYLIYGRKRFPKKIDLAKNWDSKIYGRKTKKKFTILKNDLPNRSGFSVASADINGDGFDDIIIASPFLDGPHNRRNAGAVSVIFGKKNLPKRIRISQKAGITILGAREESYTGYTLATGDINGDGKYDILIGASFDADKNSGKSNKTGMVYGLFGRAQFPLTIDLKTRGVDLTITGKNYRINNVLGSLFGSGRSGSMGHTISSGDINGDGIDDIHIGVPNALSMDRDKRDAGEIYIILGNKSLTGSKNLQKNSNISILGVDRGDITGHALTAGDVNGDGVKDIIVGAPGAITKSSKKRRKTGKVYVIYGMKEIPPPPLQVGEVVFPLF